MFLQILTGLLIGIGLFFILADLMRVPYMNTTRAALNLSKEQRSKESSTDIWLKGLAIWLSGKIRLNEFKRALMAADLKTAQMDITPEMFISNAVIKSLIIGVMAIPILFIFPLLSPVILFLAVFLYFKEIRSVGARIRAKRDNIEYELPRLVFTVEKTLQHSRDVLFMLKAYSQNAGKDMKNELEITVADMQSGNYESAITRLETRVGSSMMSDVCRGLIGILRGDETQMYWANLEVKFNDYRRQQLRAQANKVPGKVKRLSMCLLICFLLVYVVVILSQIMVSLGAMF